MEITNVRITPVIKDNSRLKGIAVITLDNIFIVRDIRIIEGDNGLFVAMPSFKLSNGNYRDVCHPINNEFQDLMHQIILNEYFKLNE